ncbi:hypothetical protein [Mastigocladopsis repens]|uniref:hypothetical protein n=1 Tax=Mastigocladopsis repens TaxID=221287 RepID=UPI00031F2564|nr:hypothetical protein [Mastigocladopsis repens]
MAFTKPIIAVNDSPSSTGVTLTLESTGVILGILVSASVLAAAVIKIITSFNNLANTLKELDEDLIKHIASEGHEKLIARLHQIEALDKKLDLHIQDYVNRKDTVQMVLGQLNEKIDHKFNRLYNSMRDVEGYLQREGGFRIRQYHEDKPDQHQ